MPDLSDPQEDKTIVSRSHDSSISPLQQHSVIDGVYEIEREIGSGGAGSVYQVKQRLLEKSFALKILHDTFSETTMLRFQNEAKIAASLEHPNLVRAFHSGVLPDGKPFYVMDLISGMTLAQHLEKGPLRPAEVIEIFLPLCLALDYAHARGLVHRDIKPGNTVLTIEDGKIVPKIIDFGIAHLALSEGVKGAGLTRTGEIFGTPKYMSPEQCLSKKVDQRSDIYSLGCMMYECLTGKVPLMGENAVATSMLHVTTQPQALRDALPSRQFQRGWQEIIDQMLAKEPSDRFQSCAQVAHALEAVRDNTVELSPKRKTAIQPGQPKKAGMRPSVIATIVGAILLATAGGVGLLRLNYNDDSKNGKYAELDAHLPAPPESLPSAASFMPSQALHKKKVLDPFSLVKRPKPPRPADNAIELNAQKFPYSQRLLNEALAAGEKGNWSEAMSKGRKSFDDLKKAAGPEDVAALSLRSALIGLALLKMFPGNQSILYGASINLSTAINQNPYVSQYYLIRSRIYRAMGEEKASAQDVEEAKKLAGTPTECDRILAKLSGSSENSKTEPSGDNFSKTGYVAAKKMLAAGHYKSASDAFKSLLDRELTSHSKGGTYDQKQASLYQALIGYSLYRLSDSVGQGSLIASALSSIDSAIDYNNQPAEFYHIKSMILKRQKQEQKAQEADDIFVEKNRENANPEINDELRKILYESQPAN